MLPLYSRTVMLGFIVNYLAINIAYAPLKRGESSSEKPSRIFGEIEELSDDDEVLITDNNLQRTYTTEEIEKMIVDDEAFARYLQSKELSGIGLQYPSTKFSENQRIPENLDEFNAYNYLQSFESLALTTPDKSAVEVEDKSAHKAEDKSAVEDEEIEVCYKNILFHFKGNNRKESCKSFAMLHLTINTQSMMEDIYAKSYYFYLKEQIKVGHDMRSPKLYCSENPDLSVTTESSSQPVTYRKKWIAGKKKSKDERVSILEDEFGTTADVALLTAYDYKIIDGLKTYNIKHQYMTHLNTTVYLEWKSMHPRAYCEWYVKNKAQQVSRQPVDA